MVLGTRVHRSNHRYCPHSLVVEKIKEVNGSINLVHN
jgi:hypothetical protein